MKKNKKLMRCEVRRPMCQVVDRKYDYQLPTMTSCEIVDSQYGYYQSPACEIVDDNNYQQTDYNNYYNPYTSSCSVDIKPPVYAGCKEYPVYPRKHRGLLGLIKMIFA